MNLTIMMGRLTRDPEVRSTAKTTVANIRIAVDRRFKRDGQPDADFFDCVAFGPQAEFLEKYFKKGTKGLFTGRLENDNYTDKDGKQVYRTRIMVESIEFAESKKTTGGAPATTPAVDDGPMTQPADDFVNIADDDDEELPFN